MFRIPFLVGLLAALVLDPLLLAGQTKDEAQKETAEEPRDADAINRFMSTNFPAAARAVNSDPEQASKILDEIEQYIESTDAKDKEAEGLLDRARLVVEAYRQQLRMAQTTVEELVAKLNENPDDAAAIGVYAGKMLSEIGQMVRRDAGAAEEKLAAAKKFLEDLKENSDKQTTQRAVDAAVSGLARIEPSIVSEKKKAELIGKDAAPLAVDAWVNGSPLTDEDLKGKVVLLDFWAVWCGPCIRTFPHLREWNEQYADRGLVMIGLTRYYNYSWDDEQGRASKSKEELSPEEEHETLEKFAEHHELHHRFAIQTGREMSSYYGVSGIPHVVLIDRENKIRLMRVGSGSESAQDIEEMLEKLLGETSAGDS